MNDLILPLDFERRPEFWQLTERLRAERLKAIKQTPPPAENIHTIEAEIAETAICLWVRLWVVLGYLARYTNRPGWLSPTGERQVNGAFRQFGDAEENQPVHLMFGNLLRPMDGEGKGYFCELFASLHRHMAGDYVPPERRGNIRSALKRAQGGIAATANQLALILGQENAAVFKRRDASVMDPRTIDRSMVLVMTVDRCLKQRQRTKGDFSEGLMADACAVVEKFKPDDLQEFYYWLAEKAEGKNPALPETTEAVLQDWDRLWNTFKAEA